jgi:SAM-dependent methyltransferase
MRLNDGSIITEEQIEKLNAHGPYSMAVWTSGDVSVGNEEGLEGRSGYFMKLIRKAILDNYSIEEIKKFSILDIGCNDGWVLHQLSDLPFAKMVGIEPREKNIAKGNNVREILKLDNSVEYRVGDIESLAGEVFDIVICAGVLYHVESIPVALRKVRESCRRMVFIESRCISSKYITTKLREEIEMRDLVYQFKEDMCGVTAQKYESAYHDGSAAHTTIVNVPTTETLVMYLTNLGFENVEVVADSDTYRESVWKDKRPLGGVCITAMLSQETKALNSEEDHWISEYEKGLEQEVLPRHYIEPLYRIHCLRVSEVELTGSLLNTHNYLTSSDGTLFMGESMLPENYDGKYALEIVKNWRYSPCDKIALEYGKLLKQEKLLDEALDVLKGVTTRLNADWRSVYRSFHLISEIYLEQHKSVEATRYRELCLNCNPKYPIE